MITADSNVFMYFYDEGDPAKQAAAQIILPALAAKGGLLGLQVVGEVQNVLRRKMQMAPWRVAQAGRNLLTALGSFGYSRSAVERALGLYAAGTLSYRDSLLLVSADEAGCTVLLSEDMQDRYRFGNVEIVNPFAEGGGLTPRARELLELQ